eukprot:GHVO01015704.1.p1 GENE.GHVO01015704.1~~GHVO01015704.1.p1  ORF type:complete len:790 (+),score=176.94 GHVO01015704.1:37-2406(+)
MQTEFQTAGNATAPTEVEPVESHPPDVLKRNEPVLRLRATNQRKDTDELSSSSCDNTHPNVPMTLELGGFKYDEGASEKHIQSDGAVETIKHNGRGLHWGEKKSTVGDRWFEKWMEQRRAGDTGEDPSTRAYGRSIGVSQELKQRWTVKWDANEETKTVEKHVQKFDEELKTMEEDWDETITEDHKAQTTTTVKVGKDLRDGRRWNNTTTTKCGSRENSTFFEEVKGSMKRGYQSQIDEDASEQHKAWMEDSERNEIMEDRWYTNPEGDHWGEKSGIKNDGEGWSEKWRYTENGRLQKSWTSKKDNLSWGERNGVDEKFERYCEKWSRAEGEDGRSDANTIDISHEYKGDRWGEKTNRAIKKIGTTECIEKRDEKWSCNSHGSNTVEKFGTIYEEDPDEPGCIHMIKYTKKMHQETDGTEWGEVQEETMIVELGQDPVDLDEGNDDVKIKSIKGTKVDKWWKEASGNKWGNKKFLEHKDNGERVFEEKWYDNGFEKQVDRWIIEPDGSSSGEKFGSKGNSDTTWKEQWAKDKDGERVLKEWIEEGDSQRHRWGEILGKFGNEIWTEKWNVNEDQFGNWKDEKIEKFEDDGLGNFKTEKTGSVWSEGVCHEWYSDRFGECLGRSEKWAHKEAKNHAGQWLEKWNELPNEKSASKTGSNTEGDMWSERWNESHNDNTTKKWAEKTGSNIAGEVWSESWFEHDENEKRAKKTGRAKDGQAWEEEWGEIFGEDGAGEKWCRKYGASPDGSRWGASWGDRWNCGGSGGHRWGEKWSNEEVSKWWHDTEGRPAGC